MSNILKIFILFFVTILSTVTLEAAKFSKASSNPQLIQTGEGKIWCSVCGMNLKKFYKTSHAVILKDGTKKQFCSIRCLVAIWPQIKDRVKEILVVDAKSEKLIPAKKAYYVVGSKVKGTMSMVSKIAFLDLEDAKEFQKVYGGEIVDFKKAFKTAQDNYKKDLAMLKKKKEKMIYPKGEKIYKKVCKEEIDKNRFNSLIQLKKYLKKSKVCGDLKGKKLQMLALYIWEAKEKKSKTSPITVPKEAKCIVCGMFVAKYPRWAAKVVLEDKKELYFDGAKDMFKFLLEPQKYGFTSLNVKDILINDYYHQNAINAKDAFYVIGSDVFGPMGNELIPFKNIDDAKTFMQDHKGKKILRFHEITKEEIERLD